MCSHDKFLKQGALVLEAPTNVAAKQLAKDSGIKGIPLLSSLNMLNFPFSFLPRTYWEKEAGLPLEPGPRPLPVPTAESGMTSLWMDSMEASHQMEQPERRSEPRLRRRTTWKLPAGRNNTSVPHETDPELKGSATQPPRTGPIKTGI